MLNKSLVIFFFFAICLFNTQLSAETLSMTCYSDDGKVSKWSKRGSNLIIDNDFSWNVNNDNVERKPGKNVFLVKQGMNVLVDFDNKQTITTLLGMEFKNDCF